MVKPKVYVTRLLLEDSLALLKERCEVEMNPGFKILPKKEFLEKVRDKDAILVSHTPIDAEICEAIKSHCKILATNGVGYNNVDVEAATKCGIWVTNNPEAVKGSTADFTWALILSTARRIVECDQFVRAGRKDWGPLNLLGAQVSEKTIGIIGAGRVGTAVGKRAVGFDVEILYTDVAPSATFEAATNGRYVDMETLLKNADFVTLHVPSLPSTHHLIGREELNMMKPTAILINVARGDVVDEAALLEALRDGTIAGAGLDVFEREPEITPGLAELPNVVLAPHVATATKYTRIKQGEASARNIFAALDGKIPANCLNPEAKG
ncbi:2-hydroxyacid dehydrogenase [Pelosinus propionicus]|uniref:Lactate dehydrogenase n=1 Tax=Pelosinus propionicus DSM 13327 TaxID=1123291 RepID=A0A1I4M374_9FIRM|nr:D-glycerate dehydrogenase [Pelosinus propionicus]SFL97828.1 Lactate dehydrogenase [Pelosinus propionicus DSM 13327]